MFRGSRSFPPWVLRLSSNAGFLLLLAGGVGCSSDMTPVSLVARVRILAVMSEPPEVSPGQTTNWSALVAVPPSEAESITYSFAQCTPADDTCLEYEEALILTEGDEDAADLLYQDIATRSGASPVENLYVEVKGEAISTPQGALSQGSPMAQAEMTFTACDTTLCEGASPENGLYTATKRLVLSNNPSPNHNPRIGQVVLNGDLPLSSETHPIFKQGEEYSLTVTLTPGSVEHYQIRSPDGELEDRVEEPYVRWFTTAGSFGLAQTSFTQGEDGIFSAQTTFTSQESAGNPIGIYLVVWDQRGGMAYGAWMGEGG